jgi:hypothetical protein
MILVQSSTLFEYPELRKTQEETWVKNSVIPVYFFEAGTENKITDNTIKVKSGQNYIFMFITAVKAFEQALQFDWEYLVKTDNSCYIDTVELKQLLSTKPKIGLFCGKEVDFIPNILPFIWGECMIFSRDVITDLITLVATDPYPKYGMDDVIISQYLKNLKWDTTLKINTPEDPCISPIYRCQPIEKSIEKSIENMRKVHSEVLKKIY